MLTAEDVVKRIAVQCAYVDERGGVGIRLKPAADRRVPSRRFLAMMCRLMTAFIEMQRQRPIEDYGL